MWNPSKCLLDSFFLLISAITVHLRLITSPIRTDITLVTRDKSLCCYMDGRSWGRKYEPCKLLTWNWQTNREIYKQKALRDSQDYQSCSFSCSWGANWCSKELNALRDWKQRDIWLSNSVQTNARVEVKIITRKESTKGTLTSLPRVLQYNNTST